MRGWYLFIILVGLLVLGTGIWTLCAAPDAYSGKMVFDTEQEYVEFKQVLADPNISISDVQTLSSDPPIVVDFAITVPKNYDFPYGTNNVGAKTCEGIIMCVCGGILVVLFGCFFITEKDDKFGID